MATIVCQTCNNPNPDTLEICQFCGTPLKNRVTEPLPTIHPGEVPVKQQTSELESTLPSWLRDMRKGDDNHSTASTPAKPSSTPAAPPAKPTMPPKHEASPLDFLAGLSQIDDEEEAEPDWLTNLKGNLPSDPASAPQAAPRAPVDWMAGLTGDSSPISSASAGMQPEQPEDWLSAFTDNSQPQAEPSEKPAMDWGYGNLTDEPEATTTDWGGFNDLAEEPAKPAESISEETPDWLTALKAQDTSLNASPQPKAEDFSSEEIDTSAGNFPDWLSNLGGESNSAAAASEPFSSSFTDDSSAGGDDLSGWLAGMSSEKPASPVTPAVESPSVYTAAGDTSASSGDFPDWLANLGGEAAPESQKPQPLPSTSVAPVTSQDSSTDGDFPDWLANLGSETVSESQKSQPASLPAAPIMSQDSSALSGDFPDWLANLGGETVSESQKSQPASLPAAPIMSQDSSDDLLSESKSEIPAQPVVETPSGNSASIFDNLLVGDEIGWLDTPASEKPEPAPTPAPLPKQKAFSTGSLDAVTPLKKTDEVPDWLAGLNATTPKKPSEPDVPTADAFDWLSGSNAAQRTPPIAESKPTGQSESAVEKPKAAAELPSSAFIPDSSQNLDSIFSMEMPDWLSGFTPSEPAVPAQPTSNEQPATLDGDNLSPADLPSWVQAMRPIESMVSDTQNSADDQVVEQVGPLAGLRSVLPAQANAPGVRKPKAYSIKLQVDSTQLAQATLLEKLIASEAESRPVVTGNRTVNFRPLRWVIAVVLLLATLIPAIMNLQLFPLPVLPDSSQAGAANAEVKSFYDRVDELPDAAKVLVVFDYQPGYAGEMEQASGPVIGHLMSKNVRMAFVSTLPTGILMSERLMDRQNKIGAVEYQKGNQYADLGYLPGDAAGIQVFAENPSILGNDYRDGDLWSMVPGVDQIGNQLSNFDAAIVLTDNPDTARIWIEQAGAALQAGLTPLEKGTKKPMLMVVSAQAAPMILPYYASGQIKGLVSGLTGGVLYETAAQQPKGNKASFYYWDSYGTGMIAAELLIVIGAVWALIQRLQTRRAAQNQEEDEE